MGDAMTTSLSSERLLLRNLEPCDAAGLSGYRSLPEVARFQSWSTFDLDDAQRLVSEQAGCQPGVPGTWFQFAIVEKTSGSIMGDCGLHCLSDDPHQMELGITLDPRHQKRGYATEALSCVLDFVFTTLAAHRVSAITDAANLRAASLFRRLGFRQEAHFIEHRWYKSAWNSEFVFALLHREWIERQGRGDL
jgi:RimJ/RimL family protein N-acetyltransferase